MINREQFKLLLDKYISGGFSQAERSEFFTCVSSGIYDDLLSEHIDKSLGSKDIEGSNLPPYRSGEILHKILAAEKQNSLLVAKRPSKIKLLRWAIAAAVSIGIVFSFFIYENAGTADTIANFTSAKKIDEKINSSLVPMDITMEDGTVIPLSPVQPFIILNIFFMIKEKFIWKAKLFSRYQKMLLGHF